MGGRVRIISLSSSSNNEGYFCLPSSMDDEYELRCFLVVSEQIEGKQNLRAITF